MTKTDGENVGKWRKMRHINPTKYGDCVMTWRKVKTMIDNTLDKSHGQFKLTQSLLISKYQELPI